MIEIPLEHKENDGNDIITEKVVEIPIEHLVEL